MVIGVNKYRTIYIYIYINKTFSFPEEWPVVWSVWLYQQNKKCLVWVKESFHCQVKQTSRIWNCPFVTCHRSLQLDSRIVAALYNVHPCLFFYFLNNLSKTLHFRHLILLVVFHITVPLVLFHVTTETHKSYLKG